MWTVERLLFVATGLFVAQMLLHILINPTAIRDSPGADRVVEMVEQRGTRAMGIFAIVLVVANFILDSPAEIGTLRTLALAITLLSGGFLMIAFTLELIGSLSIFLFKLQEDALSYAGLLLFSGLYFVVASAEVSAPLATFVLVFVGLAWAIWLYYKCIYLFEIQRRIWRDVGKTRREYVCEGLQDKF